MTHLFAVPERKRLGLLFLTALLLLLGAGLDAASASAENVANPNPGLIARWEPCEPNTGVTVIVDEQKLAEGKIYVGCALGEQSDGAEALQKAGFDIEGTQQYGLAFICRIEGEPTSSEQTCEQSAPADAYWSYWSGRPGGRWSYSGAGALSPQSKGAIDAVQGWSFGGGSAPRIEPMDGSGPSAFVLPPEQASSVIPARLASEYLTKSTLKTVSAAEANGGAGEEEVKLLLSQAVALESAGVQPATLKPISEALQREYEPKPEEAPGVTVPTITLWANPEKVYPPRFAEAVLGLHALGQDTEDFAGMHLRATLEGTIEEGEEEGKVREPGRKGNFTLTEEVYELAPPVLALARTGTLPGKAIKSIELILAQQTAAGQFGPYGEQTETSTQVEAIEALVAAREQGEEVLGKSLLERIEGALQKAGSYLESIQESGGAVRKRESREPVYDPSVESTALAAVGLALAGDHEAAQQAAKWVSQYQITAEYAGIGNPEAGQHTPAESAIGAFLPGEAALRNALAYGIATVQGVPESEAQLPTARALQALQTAGPYGPYDAIFDQESLFFEDRPVGSASKPLAATLTNEDVRPVTIATVGISGQQAGAFEVVGGNCAGTLQPGKSCEAQVSFDPTTTGLQEAMLQASVSGTGQTIQIAVSGTGTLAPEKQHEKEQPPSQKGTESPPGGGQSTGVLRIQMPRLDGLGASRGLVGVSWRVLQVGPGVKSWTIASKALGVDGAHYVTRATGKGTSLTSALLKLPAGHVYELRATFIDADGRTSSVQIGRVVVPEDDRWRGLRYKGHWQRMKLADAWLDTIARGVKGAQVSVHLPAGRPVFVLRATQTAAKVEVRYGSHRQAFTVAKGSATVMRHITAAKRAKAGVVRLRVLKGTVDLDGVADEG